MKLFAAGIVSALAQLLYGRAPKCTELSM